MSTVFLPPVCAHNCLDVTVTSSEHWSIVLNCCSKRATGKLSEWIQDSCQPVSIWTTQAYVDRTNDSYRVLANNNTNNYKTFFPHKSQQGPAVQDTLQKLRQQMPADGSTSTNVQLSASCVGAFKPTVFALCVGCYWAGDSIRVMSWGTVEVKGYSAAAAGFSKLSWWQWWWWCR